MTFLIAVPYIKHSNNINLCTDKEVFMFDASVNMDKNVIIIYKVKIVGIMSEEVLGEHF
jgi:hypothetical protein